MPAFQQTDQRSTGVVTVGGYLYTVFQKNKPPNFGSNFVKS